MNEYNRITHGNIKKALIHLALPIMGTSFLQMAYNMTDMIWLGRVGSNAVASVGTAGFYTWLAMALIIIPKIGAEVGVAQSIGKKDIQSAKNYARHTIHLNIFLGIIYASILLILRKPLIDFFQLGDAKVIKDATDYLVIVSFGLCFYFINPVFTAIYNGYGNSKIPFYLNTIGLMTNMVLDPMLIFGVGPFPLLGVKGAAIATVGAQFVVTMVFIIHMKRKFALFQGFKFFVRPDKKYLHRIVQLGLPVALQNGLFTIFAMFLARIVASFGPITIAVQKVGSQIEAISWMTSMGFSTALSTFVGQNYGSNRYERIQKGYFEGIKLVSMIGILATILLIFFAKPIFSIFIPEKEAIELGIDYLQILGVSQLFMCIEITTGGAFNGMGRTVPPAVVGILFTGLRVPAAMLLSSPHLLGLNGVWWSISITSVIKGLILFVGFMMVLKNLRKTVKKDIQ